MDMSALTIDDLERLFDLTDKEAAIKIKRNLSGK